MAVLHFFLVNSPLIYILFSLTGDVITYLDLVMSPLKYQRVKNYILEFSLNFEQSYLTKFYFPCSDISIDFYRFMIFTIDKFLLGRITIKALLRNNTDPSP